MLPGRSDDPAVYAEQALLGALLQCPTHIGTVAGQLQPGDFYHPAHQAIYEVLLDQHRAGHPATRPSASDDEQANWFFTAMHTAALASRVVTPTYGNRLIDYCPRPAHTSTYARMVLAGSLRRTLAVHAQRLSHTARIDATGNLGIANTATSTREVTLAVRHATTRWGTTGPPPNTIPPAAFTAPSPPTQQDDETSLIGALAGRPEALRAITTHLHPEDLTSHIHQTLYRCMTALHHRGDPVDPVTLLWEAHHRAAITPQLTPDGIIRLATPNGGDPYYWADRLLQATLLRTATTTGHTIHTPATDPTIAPGPLLAAAQDLLTGLTHTHHRWQQATGLIGQRRTAPRSTGNRIAPPDSRSSPDFQVAPHRRASLPRFTIRPSCQPEESMNRTLFLALRLSRGTR